MDKLFLRNFDIFSNKDLTGLNIERLCEDDGDGTVECPFKADCRFKEIKSGENRQEIIECVSNCDESDIVQFPLTKTPGTTSDKAQIGKNNMFYIASNTKNISIILKHQFYLINNFFTLLLKKNEY